MKYSVMSIKLFLEKIFYRKLGTTIRHVSKAYILTIMEDLNARLRNVTKDFKQIMKVY